MYHRINLNFSVDFKNSGVTFTKRVLTGSHTRKQHLSTTPLNILVVDDEPELAEVISYEIELLGHKAFQADSGNKGLAIVQSQKIDLVISDIMMPDGNGLVLLDQIRTSMGTSPKMAIMSGYADVPHWEIFDRGADAFFGKPFPAGTIEAFIRDHYVDDMTRWLNSTLVPKENLEIDYPASGVEQSENGLSIGRGGMFLGGFFPYLKREMVVEFKIGVAGMPLHIEGVGVVKWTRQEVAGLPPGCGIEFKYLVPAIRRKLIQVIKSSNAIAYIPKWKTGNYCNVQQAK